MRTHWTLLPALTASALIALAGCGSETSSPPPNTPTEHGRLAHCLTEHGVTVTAISPAGPPAGVDQTKWDEAMAACSSLAPGPVGP